MAWTALKAGGINEAQTAIKAALRLGTRDAKLLYHAGMIARDAGDQTSARDYLKRTLALNSRFDQLQSSIALKALENRTRIMTRLRIALTLLIMTGFLLGAPGVTAAQANATRTLSGQIISSQSSRAEVVAGAFVIVRSASGEQLAVSDADGSFRLAVPDGALTLRIEGKNLKPLERIIGAGEATKNLRIGVEYGIPPVHESVVIVASQLDPAIERRNEAVYRYTLFGRDDQLLFTLNGGINAGQHEGGGKPMSRAVFCTRVCRKIYAVECQERLARVSHALRKHS